MDYSSGESSDPSDSDTRDCEAKSYLDLTSRKLKVRCSGSSCRCLFWVGKKRRDYQGKDLLQHATGLSASNLKAQLKANHRAVAKYLNTVLADAAGPSLPSTAARPPEQEDKFVVPWTGVIVSVPTEFKNGKQVGERGTTRLEEKLI